MKQERLTYLIGRIAEKTISAEEKEELRVFLNDHDETELAESGFVSWLNEKLPVLNLQEQNQDVQLQVNAILSVDKPTAINTIDIFHTRTAHRTHFLRKWGWAAAIIVVFRRCRLPLDHFKENRTTACEWQQISTNGYPSRQSKSCFDFGGWN